MSGHASNLAAILDDGALKRGLKDCPECGTKNNLRANPDRCYSCGHEWGDA